MHTSIYVVKRYFAGENYVYPNRIIVLCHICCNIREKSICRITFGAALINNEDNVPGRGRIVSGLVSRIVAALMS